MIFLINYDYILVMSDNDTTKDMNQYETESENEESGTCICHKKCDECGIVMLDDECCYVQHEDDDEDREARIECEHMAICNGCIHETKRFLHYYHCPYCILLGNPWDEEWDSQDEVVSRAFKFFEFALTEKTNFLESEEYIKLDGVNDDDAFNIMYRRGIEIGKQLRELEQLKSK